MINLSTSIFSSSIFSIILRGSCHPAVSPTVLDVCRAWIIRHERNIKAEPAGSFQGNFIMHGIRSKTQRHMFLLYSNPFLYTSQKIRLLLFSHALKRLILSSDKPLPISDQGKPLPCAAQYLDMRSAAKAGVTVWLLMYSPALSFA